MPTYPNKRKRVRDAVMESINDARVRFNNGLARRFGNRSDRISFGKKPNYLESEESTEEINKKDSVQDVSGAVKIENQDKKIISDNIEEQTNDKITTVNDVDEQPTHS